MTFNSENENMKQKTKLQNFSQKTVAFSTLILVS